MRSRRREVWEDADSAIWARIRSYYGNTSLDAIALLQIPVEERVGIIRRQIYEEVEPILWGARK